MSEKDAVLRANKPARAPSPRRRSRELALQGLYQWLLGGADVALIDAQLREPGEFAEQAEFANDFAKCDQAHFDALLHGVVSDAAELDVVLARHVDRKTSLLSPVEHALLLIGAYELRNCLDIPYRVVINEAVELAKSFGGTDGHKYVNGVLDKTAGDLRPAEVASRRATRAG